MTLPATMPPMTAMLPRRNLASPGPRPASGRSRPNADMAGGQACEDRAGGDGAVVEDLDARRDAPEQAGWVVGLDPSCPDDIAGHDAPDDRDAAQEEPGQPRTAAVHPATSRPAAVALAASGLI